ncbi:MAG: hydrolase 2, exosortase A system-associated [Pseudomonadota bacterium]|nr:hydrolase 2, exosortase A system-associated [Pseudomonadota bacterium]
MNAPLPIVPNALPFFFNVDPGTRFCLYHGPNNSVPARGAILYVHPFAEEINKTRRMATLQARAFAAMGYAVLQMDLFGCGDSCGDFQAGRWEQWKRDLGVAAEWLAERTRGLPLHLWGVRLGALLALDFATIRQVESVILWQPFINGRTCINQFLRLRLAAAMDDDDAAPRSTSALRAELVTRGRLEVAGYELDAAMVRGIDACDAAGLALLPCSVHWFASGAPAARKLAAAAARLDERWGPRGVTLHFHPVDGVPFWATNDITECPALLATTGAVFAAGAS